mmetsp:Transcript_73868/g.175836  ORF Transcript_73868/g.175836 Transcript_73868/m.175836 type:complete len:116 (+) Transcript_73868:886-1233(+)
MEEMTCARGLVLEPSTRVPQLWDPSCSLKRTRLPAEAVASAAAAPLDELCLREAISHSNVWHLDFWVSRMCPLALASPRQARAVGVCIATNSLFDALYSVLSQWQLDACCNVKGL